MGDSWGSIPPLRMPSLLPHDLCHGRSSSRWLPAVLEFQLSYSRSWKMMLWKVLNSICNMQYALNMQYAGSRHWEGLGAGGEGDNRGWDGWMALLIWWTWVWVNSGSWWWTGRPGMLRFMGSQRVRHDWATELNWTFGWSKYLSKDLEALAPAMIKALLLLALVKACVAALWRQSSCLSTPPHHSLATCSSNLKVLLLFGQQMVKTFISENQLHKDSPQSTFGLYPLTSPLGNNNVINLCLFGVCYLFIGLSSHYSVATSWWNSLSPIVNLCLKRWQRRSHSLSLICHPQIREMINIRKRGKNVIWE